MVKITLKSVKGPIKLETKFTERIGKKRIINNEVSNVLCVSSDGNFDNLQMIEIDRKPVGEGLIDHPDFGKFLKLRKHGIAFNGNFSKEQFEILNNIELDSNNILYKLKKNYGNLINAKKIVKGNPIVSDSKIELLSLLDNKNKNMKAVILPLGEISEYIDVSKIDKFGNVPIIENTFDGLNG